VRRPVGSIRDVGGGRYRVAVSLGTDEEGNRRRIDRTYTCTPREAELHLARLLVEAGDPSATDQHQTLAAYHRDVWLPHVKERVRARTYTGYESNIDRMVTPYLGHIALDDLSPMTLDTWLDRLKRDGVSAHSSLHAFRVMRQSLRQAVKWRLIAHDPSDAVKAPRPKPYEPATLTADEARSYIQKFEGHPIEPAIALALGCGLRRSEICGMRWSDVELDEGLVHVRRGMHSVKGGTIIEDPKTARSRRTVTLPKWAEVALSRHVQPVGHVLANYQGEPLTPSALSSRFREATTSLALAKVPLKNLRHSSATLALEAGVDVTLVSRRLGHSTITTTDRFYLVPKRSADERAAQMIDDYLAPARAKPADDPPAETGAGSLRIAR
jgi:integrase